MSLSRILNDEPSPAPSLPSAPAPPAAPPEVPASQQQTLFDPPPRTIQLEDPAVSQPDQPDHDSISTHISSATMAPSEPLLAEPTPSKRRRKAPPSNNEEPQRRSTRKRGRQKPAETDKEPEVHPSSDLEDCRDIWSDELNGYKKQTQNRMQQVTEWFEASVLDHNSSAAQKMSHHYARKIARMPVVPSPSQLIAPLPGSTDRLLDPSVPMDEESQPMDMDHPQDFPAVPFPPEPQKELTAASKGKGKAAQKRAASLTRSELDMPEGVPMDVDGPLTKRRKVEHPTPDVESSSHTFVSMSEAPTPSKLGKGKGKTQINASSDVVEGLSQPGKPGRKKGGPKKKNGLTADPDFEAGVNASVTEGTPAISRQSSPALNPNNIVYELGDAIPSLKKAKRTDEAGMLKRVKALEDAQRKVWTTIAKRDIVKVYRYHSTGYQARQAQSERLAKLASVQARRPFTKTAKSAKDVQTKAKRMMREMQVFWKKNEKEERDVRKRENKEAKDRLKVEEEKREAARQARKLEFLISQTELYSHFVGSKLKTAEVEGEDPANQQAPAGADLADIEGQLPDIDFDDADHTNLHLHARQNAQEALARARQRAADFDAQAALSRPSGSSSAESDVEGVESAPTAPLIDLDSDELNFQNPTSLSGPMTVGQPKILNAQLKEYQLKGLNWLATLYEQGINGILADEMGLGKTVQSISLLAYLAETHNIWGPFLVVAPASTLHNWQQELTRFVPNLKSLPYWGNIKDRATLRKVWSKKDMTYHKDSPFHVLITSYQMVTQDQQYFQRIKWQYMVLDEAQNIKNSASNRWKTLLGFHCRNRLLLTGTPIQNNMQELWALLHFIMPSLFDSHDEFNEWFSKDIETAAENRGGKLNEHQLKRLHMILKPFMLRRVKRHVQNELSEKIELDIYVDLSPRQRRLYRALLANVSVADLLQKAATLGDAESARSLMNLVMHFRKVCNHPELFERADVVAPFAFAHFGQSGPLNREGDLVTLPDSSTNPISVQLPELLYHEFHVPSKGDAAASSKDSVLQMFNIWSTDWIQRSLYEDLSPSAFAFMRLMGSDPQSVHDWAVSPLLRRQLLDTESRTGAFLEPPCTSTRMSLDGASSSQWTASCLSRPIMRWYVPPAVAPPISMYCTDRSFLDSQTNFLEAPMESLALYGMPVRQKDSPDAYASYTSLCPGVSPVGLLGSSPPSQIPITPVQMPEAKRLIYDSAKLARLDSLLHELKANDHRVLIYFQMTRMMDLMEEYLIYRQFKYLRLDGSSKIEERRDMVMDWQTRPDIFVFILSTKAGGLGINLTAADTVIFYDHDWNPSNDAQAMDRAHRLGQTRQVTVYRLITKGTIDERIVQLARVKKDVQDIVVGNKTFTDATKPNEIVHLLLNDEQIASMDTSAGLPAGEIRPAMPTEFNKDQWNDEGDDFFGSSGANAGVSLTPGADGGDDEGRRPTGSTRGRKRGRGAGTGATRGTRGKPGPKPKNKAVA